MNQEKNRIWESYTDTSYKKILKLCLDLYKGPRLVNCNNTIVKLSQSNMLRYVFSMNETGESKCIRDIIINYMHNAQISCSGSEIWFPKFLKFQPELITTGRISTVKALEETIKLLEQPRAKNIFKKITDLIGSTGKIIINDSGTYLDVLEINSNYSFPVKVPQNFLKIVGTEDFNLSFAKILVIEGAPSSVAEINSLLEWAYESKESLIIIARSFPEEVISTLAINFLKQNFVIIPMLYGTDIENINTHADILSISGRLPISSDLGDTFSIDFQKKLGEIFNIIISSKGLVCESKISPNKHMILLHQRLKKLKPHEITQQQILVNRIAGLANELIRVKLAESTETFLVKEELDMAINYYNNLCYLAAKVKIDHKIHVMPYRAFETLQSLSVNCKKQIFTIGGFLLES